MQTTAIASVTLGINYVGSWNSDAANLIIQSMMDRDITQFASPFTKLIVLSLGLIFLGQQNKIDAVMEAV